MSYHHSTLPVLSAWFLLLVGLSEGFRSFTGPIRKHPSSIHHHSDGNVPFSISSRNEQLMKLNLFSTRSDNTEDSDTNDKNKKFSQKNEDEEDISAFVNRIGQWPLVESQEEKAPRSLSLSSTRNPFLSPFASLLNFEEVIQMKEQKKSLEIAKMSDQAESSIKNNANANDVLNIWGKFVGTLQQSFGDFGNSTTAQPTVAEVAKASSSRTSTTVDDLLKTATTSVESALSVASTAVSPDVFSSVVKQARTVLRFQDDLVDIASSAARDRGLNASEAAERVRNTTDFVANLVAVADQVLRFGYVKKEEDAVIGYRKERDDRASGVRRDTKAAASSPGTPLFDHITSARAISAKEFGPKISTMAEMGWLSGGIYETPLERCFELGHSIVAQGISADVFWMVTDSTENEADFRDGVNNDKTSGKDIPVRTIIVRGFDASDERVDRELLFTEICNLKSQPFDEERYPNVLVHRGLFRIATEVYKDIQKYIDWSAPAQKLILTGHSVGGSISILVTLMLARDRGATFVRDKVLRVFSFGSPPTLQLTKEAAEKAGKSGGCQILEHFGLPATLVFGAIQPWDPIPRLFSEIDGLYPLVDDVGPDGNTLYSSGPPRSLRIVARALVDAWDGWGKFRDMIQAAGPQKYQHVGLQHIMLPEPVRFLTDRFVNVNVNIPAVDEIVQVAPGEIFVALDSIFPLDVFEVSYLASGIRSFLHHFFPAYDSPLVRYAQKVSKQSNIQTLQEERVKDIDTTAFDREEVGATKSSWNQAEEWLKSVVPADSSR